MKIETKQLTEALQRLRPIVGRRSGVPILQSLRLHATQKRLNILASNLDEFQLEKLECEGELEPVCISYERLMYALGGDTLTMKITKKDVLVIKFDRNEIILATQSAEDFPAMPEEKGGVKIGVNCADLAVDFKLASWVAPKTYKNFILQSVHVLGTPKMLTCEATDGRNLARICHPLMCGDFEILVPTDFVANFSSAIERKDSELTVSEGSTRIDYDGGAYHCRQLEGKYPNTRPVTDGPTKQIGEFDPSELVEVLSRIENYYVPARDPIAELSFSKDGIEIKFRETTGELELFFEGKFEKHACKVNPNSLLRCLRAIPEDKCKLFRDEDGKKLVLTSGNLEIHTTNVLADFQAKPKTP